MKFCEIWRSSEPVFYSTPWYSKRDGKPGGNCGHNVEIERNFRHSHEELGQTHGQCHLTSGLWRVPVVATANFTTKNRQLLEADDFLGNPDNRVLVERSEIG